MKRIAIAVFMGVLLFASAALAQNPGKPKTVIHVITLYWKDGTTEAQKKAVFDAVGKLPSASAGIKNVWTRSVKVQGNIGDKQVQSVIVMEFADEQALKNYANSPAQKAFYEVYLPVRGESRTSDVTN